MNNLDSISQGIREKMRTSKELKEYVKNNLNKGYSAKSIRDALLKAGYNEELSRKTVRIAAAKKTLSSAPAIIIMILIVASAIFLLKTNENPTGMVILPGWGCCESICQITSEDECFGIFHRGENCEELDVCNIGCCIDKEGYCLSNYLKGNCLNAESEFIATSECRQYWRCMTEPGADSIRGSTGFPEIFKGSQRGIAYAEPATGMRGNEFIIKALLFNKTAKNVKADISVETYKKRISLYDDGNHGDGNKDDGLYAGKWDSNNLPQSRKQFQRVNYSVEVNGENLVREGFSDDIILTSGKCIPIQKPWDNPDSLRDIIFVVYGNQSARMQFDSEIQNIIGNINSIMILSNESANINYYKIIDSMTHTEENLVIEKARQECPFYNPENDTIIFLNNDEKYCNNKEGFIETSPMIKIDYNMIRDTTVDEFMSGFCDYGTTQQDSLDQWLAPNVTIITPANDSQFNNSDIEVSFIASDNIDENISYSIENVFSTLHTGYAKNNELTKVIINNTQDGVHYIWIIATDSNGIMAFSGLRKIIVQTDNFRINITSIDRFWYNESPDINFTITHKLENKINYTIRVNEIDIFNSSANAGTLNSINLNMTPGHYFIRINATDSTNKTVFSVPYMFDVGGNQTEAEAKYW